MTSVEWLVNEIQSFGIDTKFINNAIEQAKEMEKQQIIDAFDVGQEYEYQYHINNTPKFYSETYYNETYGSKGSDECQFEPTTNTSSATICANCGREKLLHKQ